ncbi:hypothetical protein [Leptospira alstonii]|uniref:hypothetical protein n=1 Tax=Leptospira alstonii TaxID=28452 RepID=UPI000773233B|nr:hypothetical protein [Leptospira alstonii]
MIDRKSVLLSAQRALLGNISPNLRAVSIGFTEQSISIRFYYETQPSEIEYDLVDSITSEILADFDHINNIDEEIIVTQEKANQLNGLNDWIYLRFEP